MVKKVELERLVPAYTAQVRRRGGRVAAAPAAANSLMRTFMPCSPLAGAV